MPPRQRNDDDERPRGGGFRGRGPRGDRGGRSGRSRGGDRDERSHDDRPRGRFRDEEPRGDAPDDRDEPRQTQREEDREGGRDEGPRQFVVPGDLLDDTGELRPGPNTYREGGKLYAAILGMRSQRGNEVGVLALSGRYDARRGDMVIGTIQETGPSIWIIDIHAASPVVMHVNDVPWRVEFGETARYLAAGDTVLLKIAGVDEVKKVQLTMKDRACRKLSGGLVFEVSPSKVARIIGRGGSMTSTIKDATNTRMFVGQNGVIWIDGEPQDVALAMAAIRKIESEAHVSGLTDKVKAFLDDHRKSGMSQWKKAALAKEATPWA